MSLVRVQSRELYYHKDLPEGPPPEGWPFLVDWSRRSRGSYFLPPAHQPLLNRLESTDGELRSLSCVGNGRIRIPESSNETQCVQCLLRTIIAADTGFAELEHKEERMPDSPTMQSCARENCVTLRPLRTLRETRRLTPEPQLPAMDCDAQQFAT